MEILIHSSLITFAAGGLLSGIGNALMVVLGLGLVIFFHELGHFAVAKWCNVHVERFSIGIGPILWSRQKGETEYALSALPLGGYVKMLGQDDMDPNQMTSEEIAENPRSYSAKKVWQRMLIISAGVVMNIITGFGFFAIAYGMGVEELRPIVGSVATGSPAWEAGIRAGDEIHAVDGDDVESFIDIQQAIVLSSGELTISGVTADGEEFSKKVTPERGKQMRQIGIGRSQSLTISPLAGDEGAISIPGMPSSKASEPFLPGDMIVSLNGKELTSWPQLRNLTARHAAEDITYTVKRNTPGASEASGTGQADITIPPVAMRSLGIWMHIGAVQSIQQGSVAEKIGLLKGDKMIRVDELEIGKDIDPLRLPNYFADRAGQTVRLTVVRQDGSPDGEDNKVLEIVPDDKPGWSEYPLSVDMPLSIPAIGAAFRVSSRIAKIVEGSEAASIDDPEKQLQPDQRITSILLPFNKDNGPDGLGDAGTGNFEITFDKDRETNWAFAVYMIQQAPARSVRVFVEGKDDQAFSVVLKGQEQEKDWYLPIRGIRGFQQLSQKRVATSVGEACQLGFRRTRNSIVSIYLTLRSLVRQDLSAKALSGPLGIISIGYQVADSGLAQLLGFLGLLSINLAVLNFLPIPVLDGGHMVFLIWEGVTRRKPSAQVIGWAHAVGLLFIISLFLFVMYLDVVVRFLGIGAE